MSGETIWTIGHSTRPPEEFSELLLANEIGNLVDVRSYPGSKRYPHFNKESLARNLRALGINYHHLVELGGRRKRAPNSLNAAWKNDSFRAYADYMESPGFEKGVEELLELARQRRTAIMCAEAVWWRCHRGLISDYLKANQVEVIHIINAAHTTRHPYTSAARILNGKLSYRGLLGEL